MLLAATAGISFIRDGALLSRLLTGQKNETGNKSCKHSYKSEATQHVASGILLTGRNLADHYALDCAVFTIILKAIQLSKFSVST